MSLYERVSNLSKKQGISLNKLAEDIGLSKNVIYQWRTSSPKAETLEKVAEYFHVSTDYLLGRTDTPSLGTKSTIPEDLNKILDNVKSFDGKPMTDNDREAIRAFLEGRMSK
ncbi:helix-turn-helix transcriptional regulator [Enterococcus sp. DIV0660C]|uniref:helix-turn-helix domain-containing protein n=1 Tax=Enterococcus sp. DIV0660C TaxID=2230880 RepID=UPI001A8D893C|nr:helix-turn-helix transcriptional regulator [Enterococcus sp. DIV0660C]MBO0432183.1 helix-turn-helix transcriptional regulator [Enterococcus sp. DIV0660C]